MDVTNDETFTGGRLVELSFDDVRKSLMMNDDSEDISG